MRSNPFADTFQWMTDPRWQVLLLWVLLLAGVAVAIANWRRDPLQRSASHAAVWTVRVLIGAMWYQGSTWKLPLPYSDAFEHWLRQSGEHASFEILGQIVKGVMIPALPAVGTFIYFFELLLAVSLILGVFTRLFAFLAAGQAAFLWLTLYRAPEEWPWNYVFLGCVHVLLIVVAAGRSLGIDAMLWRARRTSSDSGSRALRYVS